MCLYPRLIRNPKYLPNKKNGGYAPIPSDSRARFVAIGCGECIECKQKKAREWRVRLLEEFKTNKQCSFVTLTFAEETLKRYRQLAQKEIQDVNYCDIYETDNIAAKIAIRHMLERFRKKTGKSIRHWLITERGHTNTRRVHIHGIIWHEFKQKGRGKNGIYDLNELWKNGWCFNGDYVGEKTITYISKYITKNDKENKGFHGKICASPGIGRDFINGYTKNRNRWDGKNTDTNYILPNGRRIDMPIYYRNHLYTERQREKLWMWLLDKKTRYVLGKEVSIELGEERYDKMVDVGRIISLNAGYQTPDWFNKNEAETYRKTNKWLNSANYHLEYSEECCNIAKSNSILNYQYDKTKTTIRQDKGNLARTGNDDGKRMYLFGHSKLEQREIGYEKCRLRYSRMGERESANLAAKKYKKTINNRLNTYSYENEKRMATGSIGINPKCPKLEENSQSMGKDSKRLFEYRQDKPISESNRNGTTPAKNFSQNGSRWDVCPKNGYEVIDVDTGEIYTKNEYNRIKKQLKTISYEHTTANEFRSDGSHYKKHFTKRFVQKIGKEQLELFQ